MIDENKKTINPTAQDADNVTSNKNKQSDIDELRNLINSMKTESKSSGVSIKEGDTIVQQNTQGKQSIKRFKFKALLSSFHSSIFGKENIFKTSFSYILGAFQSSLGILDVFINFLIDRNQDKTDSVIKYTRKPIVTGFYIVLIFVFGGFVWAITAPLDSATVAIGTVIFAGHKKVVQHLEGGIVSDIYVAPGDIVNKGDKIIAIDDSRFKSKFLQLQSDYRYFSGLAARLEAERDEMDAVAYPEILTSNMNEPEVKKVIEVQNKIFNSKKKQIEAAVNGKNEQIKALESRKKNFIENLKILTEKTVSTKDLSSKNIVSKEALSEAIMKETDTKTRIYETTAEIERLNNEIALIYSQSSGETLKELKEAQNNLSKTKEAYFEAKDSLEKTVVRATEAGVINELSVYTKGAVIAPGTVIAEISPDSNSNQLIIEAKIPPKDITRVTQDSKVKIKFSAFKSRTSPIFLGKVISISADIVQDKNRNMMQPGQEQGAYIALIEIDLNSFKDYPEHKSELRPGIQAEVSIVSGERTLFQYLVAPLSDQMFRALKER